MKALVTDASFLQTLGIVRCLGKRGIEVYALGEHALDLSLHSRYCKERFISPNPRNDEYVEFLARTLKNKRIDILIPVGQWSTEKTVENRTMLDRLTHLEVATAESFRCACSKRRTYELAEDLQVAFPKTIYPRSFDEVKEISRNIEYPVVVKPINEGCGDASYLRNPQELCNGYREMCGSGTFSRANLPIIQEYIVSDSTYNFSALYQNGVCKRVFMWNEIRSYPAMGGTGTYSESIYNSELREYGLRLLDKLDWHGVANIEFKLDKRDGQFKLMEMNPRFWASLDVALESGVDFPYLLCEMADGTQLEYSEKYDKKVKFHWLSRELAHVVEKPSSLPKIVADTFDRKVKSNIQPDDFRPHLLELVATFTRLRAHAIRALASKLRVR